MEESEILQNTMQGFQGILLEVFGFKSSMSKQLKFQLRFMISTNKKTYFKCQAENNWGLNFSGLVKCELRVASCSRFASCE